MKGWACWLALMCTGCITAEYSRVSVNEPIDREVLRALVPGQDDLTSCLAALGAPLDVREYQVDADRASGMALIWYWSNEAGWGAKASTVVRGVSVSLEIDWTGIDLPGCVLWFDRDLKLKFYREGMVGQLVAASRQPSAFDQ